MKNIQYSFLKDELALEEIRRHKWIESEKRNEEVGFATAALDWIEKYGEQWLRLRGIRAASARRPSAFSLGVESIGVSAVGSKSS